MDEKYFLQKEIGHGCTCKVFLAEHVRLHHNCVIKRISKEQGTCDIFLREAEFLRNLGNLYNPVLYDVDEDENYCYLIEEYITGESLKDLKQNHGFIPQERIVDIAIQICQAVNWLHSRKPYPVLFLDLKPEHVVLTARGLKLLDFGSAMYLRENCIIGKVMGTPGFAAPELIGGEAVDEQADVYSIGAVLYWLMCGKVIENDFSGSKIAGYSKSLTQVVVKCVQKERKYRYSSVEQIMDDICRIKENDTIGQLGKSLTIAVIGSQPRIGTTHFSIGLSIGCQASGFSSIYEEKNESGAIESIFRGSNNAKERNGIYYFSKFRALPRYGQAIKEQEYEACVVIRDYGCFQEELIKKYEEADVIIIIAGGKEWELKWTKELLVRYKQRRNMYYVLHAKNKGDFREKVHELGIKRAFYMVCYENPFCLKRRELRFYKRMFAHIKKDIKRSKGI